MDQRAAFIGGEGNAWYRRNAAALEKTHCAGIADPKSDPVIRAIIDAKPSPVLEVGASNGWRLDLIARAWGAEVHGIEPSEEAVRHSIAPVHVGTADKLPFGDASMACVIFGFCLYLCDRALLPQIVSEAERVLKPDGFLVVYDFAPAVETTREYHHLPGVTSYKRDHAELWTARGFKRIYREDLPEEVAVSVLHRVDV